MKIVIMWEEPDIISGIEIRMKDKRVGEIVSTTQMLTGGGIHNDEAEETVYAVMIGHYVHMPWRTKGQFADYLTSIGADPAVREEGMLV